LLDASRKEGLLEEFEHSLLAGALDFRSRVASTLMVPRERVVFVNRRMTIGSIERIAHRSGHSRLPVVGTGLDNVIGFLHVKDLLGSARARGPLAGAHPPDARGAGPAARGLLRVRRARSPWRSCGARRVLPHRHAQTCSGPGG
jgi:hypothetical protein